jgi:predicted ATP-grasp superfamily ATP-dependent carboligase
VTVVAREPVLILDANQRSALAVTRSLGRRGVPVVVADETCETLAGASKYCRASFVYPPPDRAPGRFMEALRRELAARGIRVVVPMSEVTTHVVVRDGHLLPGVRVPSGGFAALEALTDKRSTHALATKLDIPAPATRIVERPEQALQAADGLRFPLVVKPYRSRILSDGQWTRPEVRYITTLDDLRRVGEREEFRRHPFLVQEYVNGHGAGVFALYDAGRAVTFFAHRRLRERPPSGGVSVLSESVPLDPFMCELSRRILDHVAWHGVAMVEFKVREDGRPCLMEVNPRFWGSLQLAIDAGVDFPWLAYQLATGVRPDPVDGYRVGVRNRWLLGDLDHAYLSWKNAGGWRARGRAVARFLKGFEPHTKHEVDRWDDFRPFVVELKRYVTERA